MVVVDDCVNERNESLTVPLIAPRRRSEKRIASVPAGDVNGGALWFQD